MVAVHGQCLSPTDCDGDGIPNATDDDDDNDGILDIDELQCIATGAVSSVFNSSLQQWQSSGKNVTAGTVYTVNPNGSSLGTRTVVGGPNDGQTVSVIQFAGDRFVDLDGNSYMLADNTLENTPTNPRNSRNVGFANLVPSDYDFLLTFVGMIDTNGNGQYDSGVDEIIPQLFSESENIRFTPQSSGLLYIVFTDGFYGDNGGDLTFTTEDCISFDTDNDGDFDFQDLDSDNDGCFDVTEAGFEDVNGDGRLGPLPITVNAGNGTVTSGSDGYTLPRDGDTSGVPDFLEFGMGPTITQQPQSVVGCLGCTVDILVDSPATGYTWQVLNAGTWQNLTDSGFYSGTTTNTLSISGIDISLRNLRYRALVYNVDYSCATLISEEAILRVPITVISNRGITYRIKPD